MDKETQPMSGYEPMSGYDRPATIAESVQEYTLNAAHPDDDLCACRGGGWTLSSWDTWHKCPAHFNGQDHPEYDPEVMSGDEGCDADR